MVRIEVCTWDFGTGHTQVDNTWLLDETQPNFEAKRADVDTIAAMFAAQDHSTDHTVFVRESAAA